VVSRLYSNVRRALDPVLTPLSRRLLNLQNVLRRLDALDLGVRTLGGHHARSLYPQLLANDGTISTLRKNEFRVYSQHGEDGILLYIFSQIGLTNRQFVEFGVEDGTECNAANLVINFGFSGLMMDGSRDKVERGRAFYEAMLGNRVSRLRFIQSWVTAENINDTLRANGAEGEIDLLSIDIDGNDYWVWKEIRAASPRVVVAEYNSGFGPHKSVTIPYAPDFDRWRIHDSGFYFGASLAALTKLAESKGYTLVGCDSCGANAFYVRNDLAVEKFAAVPVEDAFVLLVDRIKRGFSQTEQERILYSLPVEEV
jgi:hypothetical protein